MNPQIGFLLNQALDAIRRSNHDSANLYLKQALRLQPSNPHTLRLLGVISAQQREYPKAVQYLNDSLKALPKNSLAWSNLGNVFLEINDYQNALNAFDRSLKLDSNYEEAWSNRGNVLHELKRFDEAIQSHDRAISLKPEYAEAWSNKGNALNQLKRFDEAIECYDKALVFRPNYVEALTNKGWTLHELKRFNEAIECYDKALNLNPNYHEASLNKSFNLLLQGDLKNGFPLYESRWAVKRQSNTVCKRQFDKPLWLGIESLQGKVILIYGEQGFGDFIQFSRYINLIAKLGAKIILEAPKALVNLMRSLEGVSQLIVEGEDLPEHDYRCPILSLPLATNTTLPSIPVNTPYLTAHPDKVAEWKARLGEKSCQRVGLVWSSMSNFKDDSKRSLMLVDFIQALPKEGFEYICLQKEIKECDKDALSLNKNIRFFGDLLSDFSDTAALIENLDLVISSCTSIPHLSGALGKKTWILLSYVPDWRWFLDRADSPWYPTLRLFRQSKIGDWNTVFENIHSELGHFK